jgi:hypothetical protein
MPALPQRKLDPLERAGQYLFGKPQEMQPPPQSAFDKNKAWAQSGTYKTALEPAEEQRFQAWVKQNNVPWQDTPDADYDMRGYWKAQQSGDKNAKQSKNANDGKMHFPDTYKTPYHKSFSNESQYALPNAPKWNDQDQLVDSTGKVVFDERHPMPEATGNLQSYDEGVVGKTLRRIGELPTGTGVNLKTAWDRLWGGSEGEIDRRQAHRERINAESSANAGLLEGVPLEIPGIGYIDAGKTLKAAAAVTEGVGENLSDQMMNPGNLALMFAGPARGLVAAESEVAPIAGKVEKTLGTLAHYGFTAQMTYGAGQAAVASGQAFAKGDYESGLRLAVDGLVSGTMAFAGVTDAIAQKRVHDQLNTEAQARYKAPFDKLEPHEKADVVYQAAMKSPMGIDLQRAHREGLRPPPKSVSDELAQRVQDDLEQQRQRLGALANQDVDEDTLEADRRYREGIGKVSADGREVPPVKPEGYDDRQRALPAFPTIWEASADRKAREQRESEAKAENDKRIDEQYTQRIRELTRPRERVEPYILDVPVLSEAERKIMRQEEAEHQARLALAREQAIEAQQKADAERRAQDGEKPQPYSVIDRRAVPLESIQNEVAKAPDTPEILAHKKYTDDLDSAASSITNGRFGAETLHEQLTNRIAYGYKPTPEEQDFRSMYARRRHFERSPEFAKYATEVVAKIDRDAAQDILKTAARESELRDAERAFREKALQATDPEEIDQHMQDAMKAREYAEKAQTEREHRQAELAAAQEPEQVIPNRGNVNVLLGRKTEIILPDGRKIPARYAGVRVSQVIPSHDPFSFEWNEKFEPRKMQPRDYKTNLEAQASLMTRSKRENFILSLLVSDDPTGQQGFPVMLSDGRLPGGNGRFIAEVRAMQEDPTLARRIHAELGKFDIPTEDTFDDQDPIIGVRLLDYTPEDVSDLIKLGSDLNRDFMLGMSQDEQASMNAERLTPENVERISGWLESMPEGSSLKDMFKRRSKQVLDLMVESGIIPENKRVEWMNSDGTEMTERATTTFENMMLGKAVGDPALLSQASADIRNKLARSLTGWIKIQGASDDWQIQSNLQEALRIWHQIETVKPELSMIGKSSDSIVDKFFHPEKYKMGTGFMDFGDDQGVRPLPDSTTLAIVQMLDRIPLHVKRMVEDYADDAEGLQASLMERPSPVESFNRAIGEKVGVEVHPAEWKMTRPLDEGTKRLWDQNQRPVKEAPEKAPEAKKELTPPPTKEKGLKPPPAAKKGELVPPPQPISKAVQKKLDQLPVTGAVKGASQSLALGKVGNDIGKVTAAIQQAWQGIPELQDAYTQARENAIRQPTPENIANAEQAKANLSWKLGDVHALETHKAWLDSLPAGALDPAPEILQSGKTQSVSSEVLANYAKLNSGATITGNGTVKAVEVDGRLFTVVSAGKDGLTMVPLYTPKEWGNRIKGKTVSAENGYRGYKVKFKGKDYILGGRESEWKLTRGESSEEQEFKIGTAFRKGQPVSSDQLRTFLEDHPNTSKYADALMRVLTEVMPRATGKTLDEFIRDHVDNVAFYKEQDFRDQFPESRMAKSENTVRGMMAPAVDPAKRVIMLFEKSQPATVLHEFFHVMRPNLLPEYQAVLEDFAGVEKVKNAKGELVPDWTIEAEEKVARAWEKYHYDGKAPTSALKAVFDHLKELFHSVYKIVKKSAIDVKISPAVREMFDQWYGKEPQELKPPPPKPYDSNELNTLADSLRSASTQPLTVRVVRWEVPSNETISGGTWALIHNDAADSNNPYTKSFGESRVEKKTTVTLRRPLAVEIGNLDANNTESISNSIIEKLAPFANDGVTSVQDMESLIQGDNDEFVEESLGIPKGTIERGRKAQDASGANDAIAVELLRTNGYDGAVQIPQGGGVNAEVIVLDRSAFDNKPKTKGIKAPPPSSLSTDITPQERESASMVADGGADISTRLGESRAKRFDSKADAISWAVENKDNVHGLQIWQTPDGKAFSIFVPKSPDTLFQMEPMNREDAERRVAEIRRKMNLPEFALMRGRMKDDIKRLEDKFYLSGPALINVKPGEPKPGIQPFTTIPEFREKPKPINLFPEEDSNARQSSGLLERPVRVSDGGRTGEMDEPAVRPGSEQKDEAARDGDGGRTGQEDRRSREVRLLDVPDIQVSPIITFRDRPVTQEEQKSWDERSERFGLSVGLPVPEVSVAPHIAAQLSIGGQVETVNTLATALKRTDGAILATPTGTGKTYVLMALLRHLHDEGKARKTVTITSSNEVINQKRGFLDVAKNVFGVPLKQLDPKLRNVPDGHYVTTWAMLRENPNIKLNNWDLVIFDEAQNARNWTESQQGSIAKDLGKLSKKIVWSSATPFHTGLELGYMDALGLWRDKGFREFAKQLGVGQNKEGGWYDNSDPKKMLKLNQQLVERGQMVGIDMDYSGYHANFLQIPLTAEHQQTIRNVNQAFEFAYRYYSVREGGANIVNSLKAEQANFVKSLNDRMKLPALIERIKEANKAGYRTVIFSDTYAAKTEMPNRLKVVDELMGGKLSELWPKELPGVMQELKKGLGDKVGNFSGGNEGGLDDRGRRVSSDAQSVRDLRAWQNGALDNLYSSYAKGGTGVNMNDTVGEKPVMAFYLGSPWSGVAFQQGVGRPYRYGTKSDVQAVFLTTNARSEARLMLTKVAPRLEKLKAGVNGVENDPMVAAMRKLDSVRHDVAAYEIGQEHKFEANDFAVTEEIPVMNHKQWVMPHSREMIGPDKGMRYPGGQDWKPGVLHLFQADGSLYQGGFDSIDSDKAKRFTADVSKDLAEGNTLPGVGDQLSDLDPGDRRVKADQIGPVVTDIVERMETDNKQAAARMEYENGLQELLAAKKANEIQATREGWKWTRNKDDGGDNSDGGTTGGAPSYKPAPDDSDPDNVKVHRLLLSGRLNLENIGRQSGSWEQGKHLKWMNDRYETRNDNYLGTLQTMMYDAIKGLKDKDARVFWMVKEGKMAAPDERIAKAVEAYTKYTDYVREEGARLGVKTFFGANGEILWSQIANDPNYMPHYFDWNEKHTMVNPDTGEKVTFTLNDLLKGQTLSDIAYQKNIETLSKNIGWDKSKIEDWLQKKKKSYRVKGNIERAREADLPLYRMDFHALHQYAAAAAEAFARTEVFGQQLEKLDAQIALIPNPKGREVIKGLFDERLNPERWGPRDGNFYKAVTTAEIGMKMAFSAAKLPGHLAHQVVASENLGALIKGILKTAGSLKEAERSASLSGAIGRHSYAMAQVEVAKSMKLSNILLGSTGFNWVYKLDRIMSSAASRIDMEQQLLPELKRGGKDEAHARRILHDNYKLSHEEIDMAKNLGRFTDEQIRIGQAGMANTVLWTSSPMELPPDMRGKPEGIREVFRVMTVLKSYMYKEIMFQKEQIYDQARQGNWGPLKYAALFFPIVGQLIQASTAASKDVAFVPYRAAKGTQQGSNTKKYLDKWANLYAEVTGDDSMAEKAGHLINFYIDSYTAFSALRLIGEVSDVFLNPSKKKKQQMYRMNVALPSDFAEEIAGIAFSDIGRTLKTWVIDEAGRGTWQDGEKLHKARVKAAEKWLGDLIPWMRPAFEAPPKDAVNTSGWAKR